MGETKLSFKSKSLSPLPINPSHEGVGCRTSYMSLKEYYFICVIIKVWSLYSKTDKINKKYVAQARLGGGRLPDGYQTTALLVNYPSKSFFF